MKPLSLPKLPDRSPVKRTIVCETGLNAALEDYAVLYRETYEAAESIEALIPFMLAAFLARDRTFREFQKSRASGSDFGTRYGPGRGHRRG